MGAETAEPSRRGAAQRLAAALRLMLSGARLLRSRFVEDRLAVTAGSLTFTTLIALVPLLTVMLAVFTAFPMFASLQGGLERLLVQNLVPDSIARPVMSALAQFAGKASRIGAVGLLALMATALALMLTIDRTLNALWRVRRPRPLGQRLLLYWTALTLGPLLLGASLSLASYALSASKGAVAALPGGFSLLIDLVQFALLAAVAAGLYHFVPRATVRWSHAWIGGLFVSLAIEMAKKALGWYVANVPTITSIYGAFAFVPLLLMWVYLLWVVVLVGAVITSSLPRLLGAVIVPSPGPGQGFERSLQVLQQLDRAHGHASRGLALNDLARSLQADPLDLQPLLEQMTAWGWVGQLDEPDPARWVLLAALRNTPALPLLQSQLIVPSANSAALAQRSGWRSLSLQDLLDPA